MKKIFFIVSIMLILCSNGIFSYGLDLDMSDEALKEATSVAEMVKLHLASNPEKWGYSSSEEVERLTLGQGYRIEFVGRSHLEKRVTRSDELLMDNMDMWEFTLDLDGHPKTFLTVGKEEGRWKLIGFGGDATNFGYAKNTIEKLSQKKGYTVLCNIMKYKTDYSFMCIDENETVFILPVAQKFQISSNFDGKHLLSVTEWLDELKEDAEVSAKIEGRAGALNPSTNSDLSYNGSRFNKKQIFLVIEIIFAIMLAGNVFLTKEKHSQK